MARKNLPKLKLPNFESKQPPKTLKCGRRTFVPFSCVDAKHLLRFRSQSCVFKFIRHSVDEASISIYNPSVVVADIWESTPYGCTFFFYIRNSNFRLRLGCINPQIVLISFLIFPNSGFIIVFGTIKRR